MKKTVWILTSEYNDYDQHGEYFEAVFETKPTKEQLADVMDEYPHSVYVEHTLKGGGRLNNEYCWYNLREREFD